MEILFGKIPTEDQGDSDFISEKGEHFYFRVYLGEDDLIIEDTLGRYVPIDRQNLKGLEIAVYASTKTMNAEKEANDLFKKRMQEIAAVSEFYAGN